MNSSRTGGRQPAREKDPAERFNEAAMNSSRTAGGARVAMGVLGLQ